MVPLEPDDPVEPLMLPADEPVLELESLVLEPLDEPDELESPVLPLLPVEAPLLELVLEPLEPPVDAPALELEVEPSEVETPELPLVLVALLAVDAPLLEVALELPATEPLLPLELDEPVLDAPDAELDAVELVDPPALVPEQPSPPRSTIAAKTNTRGEVTRRSPSSDGRRAHAAHSTLAPDLIIQPEMDAASDARHWQALITRGRSLFVLSVTTRSGRPSRLRSTGTTEID